MEYEKLDEVDESCRYPCAEDILPDCGGDAARERGDHGSWLGSCVRYSSVGGSCISPDESCRYSGRGDVKQTTATLKWRKLVEVILGLVGLASTPMHYQINLLLRGKSALSMIFCAITTIFWENHKD